MTPVKDFFHRQLGTAGWAPIHHAMAVALCPDVINSHRDFAVNQRDPQPLTRVFQGTRLYQAHVEGFGVIPVLSRSPQFLVERMGWLGFVASEVTEYRGLHEKQQAIAKPEPTTSDPLAMLHSSVTTKEPPRPCKSCGGLSSGQTCMPAQRGEVKGAPAEYRPDLSWPRRCLAYQPARIVDGAPSPSDYDRRTGQQLWPEVAALSLVADDLEGAEQDGAIERGMVLLRKALAAGPIPAQEIRAIAEGAGVSERSMQVAAERLGVEKTKAGFSGGWVWALPEESEVA